MSCYEALGVRRVINADEHMTVLGGSLMSDVVQDAMREASRSFVDMFELHERAGEELARLTRNEAAYVTPGAAAGITLAVLACRTRGDLSKIAGLRGYGAVTDEVIMHVAHRNPYDWSVGLAGAQIREVGNVLQTFPWELEAALSERSVAVFYVAGSPFRRGALELAEVVRIASARGVPVIVDAAAQLPPAENLWRFTQELGADIVLFSGGKDLCGPQQTGLMVGKPQWIAAARANGAPHQRYARSMKVGKEEIIGLVAAVERYMGVDQVALRCELSRTCSWWREELSKVPHVNASIEETNAAGESLPRVRVSWDVGAVGRDQATVSTELRKSEPSIAISVGLDCVYISAHCLQPGEAKIVLERLVAELRA